MKTPIIVGIDAFDAAGKDETIVGVADDLLRTKGINAELVRFPGHTSIGSKIRSVLLDKDNDKMSPMTELALFCADHAQTWAEIIELGKADVYLCNRTWLSAYIYQGLRGIPKEYIVDMYSRHMQQVQYTAYVIMDISYEESIRRLENSGRNKDRIEGWQESLKRNICSGYKELPEYISGVPVYHINADADRTTVRTEMLRTIELIMQTRT